MKVSCVIPTYNSRRYLEMGLQALTAQRLEEGTRFEVIVVDDGSSDDTASAVSGFRSEAFETHYIYRPRDEFANRSKARNLGIAKATGDVVVFLDSGVLVPDAFIQRVADRTAGQPNIVLLHETLGLHVDPDKEDMSVLDGFRIERLNDYAERLKYDSVWMDPRSVTSRYINDRLSLLPAPWIDGYSCAMSVPAALIREAGGFDEDFYGWGLEDCEFTLRLALAGAQIHFERKAYGFHYPHPINQSSLKMQSLINNSKQMHRKFVRLDTECYIHYLGLHYQAFLEKLTALPLSDIVPGTVPYDCVLPAVPSGKVLAIGFEHPEWLRAMGASHVLAYNPDALRRIHDLMPDLEAFYLLGIDTPFANGEFDAIYVSDFIRVLHPHMTGLMLQELRRIGKRVAWIHSDGEHSPFPEIDADKARRLKELSKAPSRLDAPFEVDYVPSFRNRFVMEKMYWTSAEEITTLARERGLSLKSLVYSAPVSTL